MNLPDGQETPRSGDLEEGDEDLMSDLDDLFERLQRSAFRRRFRLRDAERQYLLNKGLEVVLEHGAGFIEKRLAPADPPNDGKQTPMRNHPVFVAQHATGDVLPGVSGEVARDPEGA